MYAIVGRPDITPESRRRVGFPRSLTGAIPSALSWPRVLVIEFRLDGIFLIRYSDDRGFAGDTWHQSLEDARNQAAEEYGHQLGDWTVLPANTENPVEFASCRIAERQLFDLGG